MGRPRHLPLGLRQARTPNASAQTLAAVEGGRMREHLPFEIVVSESIAYLDLHRQQRERRLIGWL
jgi:hypothetical protein